MRGSMINNKQILILLNTMIGELETDWEATSGHDEDGAFTIIRYARPFKMGEVRKTHSLIEDLLFEHLGPGDRVQ